MNPSFFILVSIRNRVMNVTNAFHRWIISHTCQYYGAINWYSWSPHKVVSALYFNQYYYSFINLIDIYMHYLFFLSMKYVIQNDTARLLGIVLHKFEKNVASNENITIILRFISPMLNCHYLLLCLYDWIWFQHKPNPAT